jgi:hypothetical protein
MRIKRICDKKLETLNTTFTFVEHFISSSYATQSMKSSPTKSKANGILSSSKKSKMMSSGKKPVPVEPLTLKSISSNIPKQLEFTSNLNSKVQPSMQTESTAKMTASQVPKLKRQQALKENSPSAFDI